MSNFRATIQAMHNRVMLTVARAVVSLVNDGTKLQSLQVQLLKREIRENVERFQNYGFTAKPHAGAEGVVVFVGGNRDHGLCIAVDDRRYRVAGLADGEVAIYTDEGDRIHLKRNNVIEVTTETFRINAGTKVEINTPLLEVDAPLSTFSGDVQAEGDIIDQTGGNARSMAGMREVFNDHDHGGVQTGGGNTADPNQDM